MGGPPSAGSEPLLLAEAASRGAREDRREVFEQSVTYRYPYGYKLALPDDEVGPTTGEQHP